jgi:hypothetical protein
MTRAINAMFFAWHAFLHGSFGVTPWSQFTAQGCFDDNCLVVQPMASWHDAPFTLSWPCI